MFDFLMILLLLLQVADAVTTMKFLRNGKGFETNRALRWLMKEIGAASALGLVKGLAFAVIWELWLLKPPGIEVLFALCCLYYLKVVWKNWKIGRS